MQIFLTGGSGFLGQRLIRRLIDEGHSVSALSRSTGSDQLLHGLGALTVSGSLDDIERWQDALAGHDVVIHAASPIDVWGPWALMHAQITEATARLYAACGKAGVKRFIYISSEAVLQGEGPLLDIDEARPYPAEPNSTYGKAKKLAEQALLSASSTTERIIIRPTFIWGAGDKQLDTIAAKVAAKQFMWVDRGRAPMEMVHVENVVEAIRLALTKGGDGQIYTVTDDRPLPAREFLSALLATRSIPAPTTSMPGALVRPLAAGVEALWRALGIKATPPLSRFQVDFIALPRRYSLAKIKRDLGYQPVITLEEGLRDLTPTPLH